MSVSSLGGPPAPLASLKLQNTFIYFSYAFNFRIYEIKNREHFVGANWYKPLSLYDILGDNFLLNQIETN
jgi:hypothetical protein